MIRLGYAGMNTLLPSPSRTFRIAGYTEPLMIATAESNLRSTYEILRWNEANGIKVFRISSAVIPFASHSINGGSWRKALAPMLAEVGAYARDCRMRLSMHPGQYTVLNSPEERVLSMALADLDYHTTLLELMGFARDARIVLHCGGGYGDKVQSLDRLEERFLDLSDRMKCRIAFENDENICGAEILEFCKRIGTPAVFDVFHHEVHKSLPGMSNGEIIKAFAATWPKGERQKIHYSDQHPTKKIGSHSDHIDVKRFLDFYSVVADLELDIMIEAKDKEQSVLAIINALRNEYL
ncbi:MAG: UV DNA damage repair endonuclease UvsE [Methanotrichaceae archaeon]